MNIKKWNTSFIGGLLAMVFDGFFYTTNSFVISGPATLIDFSRVTLLNTSSFLTGFFIVFVAITINDLVFPISRPRIHQSIDDKIKSANKKTQKVVTNK